MAMGLIEGELWTNKAPYDLRRIMAKMGVNGAFVNDHHQWGL